MRLIAIVYLTAEDIAKIEDWGKIFAGDYSEIAKKVKIESVKIE